MSFKTILSVIWRRRSNREWEGFAERSDECCVMVVRDWFKKKPLRTSLFGVWIRADVFDTVPTSSSGEG